MGEIRRPTATDRNETLLANMPTPRQAICSAAAACLGAFAMYKTQAVTKEYMDPIVAFCSNPSSSSFAVPGVTFVPHEPLTGLVVFAPLVCIITQFLNSLVTNHPEGMITWGSTMISCLPALLVMTIEGGRSGSRGIVRYPTVLGLLGQILGISVAFPLFWVPGCLLLSSGPARGGATLSRRAYAGLVLAIPCIACTAFAFVLDPSSRPWRVFVGMLGGPILPMLSLVLWGMEVPNDKRSDPQVVADGAVASQRAYLAVGAVGLGWWWAIIVPKILGVYGLDPVVIWSAIWTAAHPSVKFMTIDAVVLWLGMVMYIAAEDLFGAFVALVTAPLLGPGASCVVALWGREKMREAVAKKAVVHKKAE